ncbi:hypothetical protein BV25DRAFT_1817543 [Artomyces pyxidatus]|uniref:Uncharacterized protein n=1 Tax=Artomyces pyxidatus TaxID=48021 RepID=A0ACB8TJT6_9AGAM|nr:hypothetical protein BV25DRAFT_1817543 [Artomyces pyxidatus]
MRRCATSIAAIHVSLTDCQALKNKSVVINRAPVMMAWSFVVSERLGFNREEALSIASVYTEMNAIAKGVSLGIYDKSKQKGIDASPSAQPYVDLMGRRVPLYQTAEGTWRALAAGKPAPPTAAYSYISRSLKQTAPAIIGAMRLLAQSYSNANELNRAAWSLYADFRPEVDGWGKKGSIRCETLLGLRKSGEASSGKAVEALVKYEEPTAILGDGQDKPPESKKHRTTPLDDEDEDALFEHFTAEELEALP